MILAVMQPYLFPYLGYFQLAGSVDHFVFLDDATFIKKGFINRNRILLDGEPFAFSVPVAHISQNRPINQHCFTGEFDTFLAQLRHAYARSPFFKPVFALVESVVLAPELNVASKCAASVKAVFDYLRLPFSSSFASAVPNSTGAGGQQRILDLCRRFSADSYHNAQGGQALYDAGAFAAEGIRLRFLQGHFPVYPQRGGCSFVPGLSIIDVLMNTPPEQVSLMLGEYDLLGTA